MKKKTYHITQKRLATMYFYYEVEATSEEEAMKLIEDGDVEFVDMETIEGYSLDDEWEVTDVVAIKK